MGDEKTADVRKKIRSDESQTARAGLFSTIAAIISFVSSMLFMPIISKLLPAEDLGRAVAYISMREIVFIVLSLSAPLSISLAMIDFGKKKFEYISSVFLFTGCFITSAFMLSLVFKRYLLFLFYGSDFLFYWFFLMMLLQLIVEITTFYASFYNKYLISFCIVLLTNTLSIFITIILVTSTNIEKYISRIIGADVSIILISLAAAIFFLVKGKIKLNLEHVKYALRISLPLVPGMVSSIALIKSDILITSHYGSPGIAGIYTMAYTISNVLYIVILQLMKSWSPWVYRKMSMNETDNVYSNSKRFMLMTFFAGVGLMTVTPELVRLFLHSEYYDCIYLICPLVAAMFFRFLNTLFGDIEYYHKRNLFNGISHAVAATVNVVLDIMFINVFGLVWCAITTAVCYGALTCVHYLYTRHIEKRNIYNNKYMLICSLATIALSFTITFTLDYFLVRYAILLAVAAIVIYHERELISVAVKKLRNG